MWATGFLLLILIWGIGLRWGATAGERRARWLGDSFFDEDPGRGLAMTRAIDLDAPPEDVWPWIAQCGRGAGWYSFDFVDNGGKRSARHLVSWIPEPRIGDATAVGYLRAVEPGSGLAWWYDGLRFLGTHTRMVVSYHVRPRAGGSRLVSRISADSKGPFAVPILLVFSALDSIMAVRQLYGFRARVHGVPSASAETGARDQFQHYEVLYAGGGSAGAPGQEAAATARRRALRDGVLP